VSTIDISERRNGSPQRDDAQGSEGTNGDARRVPPAEPAPGRRRRGLGLLTGLLAIALLVALAVIGQLLGDRQALRGEVATLTTALDEAEASRAEARATLDGVADQLLALHGTLSSLLAEAAPSGAETADAPPATTAPSIPAAEEDPNYWHDRALELAR
jgi:hypothetical protein